jgi:hypothetical protein
LGPWRSLLAGDTTVGLLAGVPNRLQAGSYQSEPERRSGSIKCLGACPKDLYAFRSNPWKHVPTEHRGLSFVQVPDFLSVHLMKSPHSNDPLHGVTLEAILTQLVAHHGWPELGRRIRIRCFNFDPSIKSSLHFLRRTPWARQEVEDLYRALRRTTGPAEGSDC